MPTLPSSQSNRFIAYLLVIIASLCYGTMPAVSQKALQLGLSVETILVGRYGIGTVFIWVYILCKKQKFQIGTPNIGFCGMIGIVIFLCTIAMNEGYKYLPGAIASILVFLYVVIVVIIEIIMGREKVQLIRTLCLFLAVCGMIAVIWTPEGGRQLSAIGIILAFTASFLYAAFAIGMGARRLEPVSAEVVMGYVMLVPAIGSIARCMVLHEPLLPQMGNGWACILILGVGAAFIAPICYCQAIKMIGASDASLINTSEPLIAYVAGILIMSDRISWNQAAGGFLIIIAIFILNVTQRKRDQEKLLEKELAEK